MITQKYFLMKTLVIIGMSLMLLAGCGKNDDTSDAYGNFEAREIMVSSENQGKLVQLELEEGAILEKGKIVGWIDTASLAVRRRQLIAKKEATASRLDNIDAQIEVQQEQLQTLKTEKNRIQRLLEKDAATEQQYDNIKGKLDVAEKQLKSIRTQKKSVYRELDVIDAQVDEMEENIMKCRIKNPIKGTVLEKYMQPGEYAVPGKAVYKLADLSTMDLRVYVSGAQLPQVKIGEEVQVLVDKNAHEQQALTGTVSWISSRAEFTPKIIQTREERVDLVYAVKSSVQNYGLLHISLPGEVNF